jgi:hypothetical protein
VPIPRTAEEGRAAAVNCYLPRRERWSCGEDQANGKKGSIMQLITVKIEKPDEINFILGQTHFIKSVEDIHEARRLKENGTVDEMALVPRIKR